MADSQPASRNLRYASLQTILSQRFQGVLQAYIVSHNNRVSWVAFFIKKYRAMVKSTDADSENTFHGNPKVAASLSDRLAAAFPPLFGILLGESCGAGQ